MAKNVIVCASATAVCLWLSVTIACTRTAPSAPRVVDIVAPDGVGLKGTLLPRRPPDQPCCFCTSAMTSEAFGSRSGRVSRRRA
jgi:hypothetical protein